MATRETKRTSQPSPARADTLPHAAPLAASRGWLWAVLALSIALAAFAVRVWTVRRGLPYVDHPDEPNPVGYVIGMLKTGDLNPHAFQKPSLYVYLLLAVLSVNYRLGLSSGLYSDLNQMFITTHVYTTLPQFFLWGRVLTAAIGGLSVWCVYQVGRRFWGQGAGVAAALFLATSPFHLRHSQYVTTDVTSGLFVLLCYAFALRVAAKGGWRDYLLAGLLAGFAASTKYNVGVAAIPIVVAHVLCWRRDLLRQGLRLVASGGAALAGFVIGTPYALLSFGEFQRGILGQVDDYSSGNHGDFTGAWNWGGYGEFVTSSEFGLVALLLVLLGLAIMAWRWRAALVLWLSFCVPYLLLHVSQGSHFTRNLIPLVVLCALPIGIACAEAAAQAARRRAWLGPVAAAAALLALLWVPVQASAQHSLRMAAGDTRVHALDWIARTLPPGTRIAAELAPIPGPIESRWTEVESLLGHDMAWYRQQGYSYILASSDVWRQWAMPEAYQSLASGPPLAEFGGATPYEMLGPHIRIYATGLSAADVPQPLGQDVRLGGARLLGLAVGALPAQQRQIGVAATSTFHSGDIVGIRSFWQVESAFDTPYLIFVHIRDAQGATVAQRDTAPWQGLFPTTSWQPGSLLMDVNDVQLPADLPAGTYSVMAGMYNPELQQHPPLQIDGALQDAGEVQIATITVTP